MEELRSHLTATARTSDLVAALNRQMLNEDTLLSANGAGGARW